MIRWPWVSRHDAEERLKSMERMLIRSEERCERLQVRLENEISFRVMVNAGTDRNVANAVLEQFRRLALRQSGDTLIPRIL